MTSDAGQRVIDGANLENKVYNDINNALSDKLKEHKKSLHLGRTLRSTRKDIFKKMCIYSINKSFDGDTDIIIYDEKHDIPEMIISTKTSIRERFYQVAYTRYLYREKYPNIEIWFVTNENKGIKTKDGSWKSELGTEQRPTKPRQLGNYHHIPIFSSNAKTNFGGCVKPYSDLNKEISKVLL